MFGTLSEEIEVKVAASKAWKLYGTLGLAKVTQEGLPHLLDKIEVLEGDGSAGTILKLTFPPGTPVISSYKEKFTKVDNEKMVKEAEVIEGGYLDLGFTLYRVRFEVKESADHNNCCITKATIEFDLKEEAAANASFVTIQPLTAIMNVAAKHLINNNNNKN